MPNQLLPTVTLTDGTVINERDFDPDSMELEGGNPSPVFRIVASMDGDRVFWDGDDFVDQPSDKTYSSEDSAEGAIARTKAIQEAITDGVITDVSVMES